MNQRVQVLVKEDLRNIVRTLVKEGLTNRELADKQRLNEDLGFDSLDMVELMVEIERLYKITLPEKETAKVRTVGDAYQLIIKSIQDEK